MVLPPTVNYYHPLLTVTNYFKQYHHFLALPIILNCYKSFLPINIDNYHTFPTITNHV